jgi:hypothetical protein
VSADPTFAKSTNERACGRGIPLASGTVVVPLVAVSGAECVEVLMGAGFSVSSRSDGAATLTKGLRVVVVPDVSMLKPEELTSILRAAGLPYVDFLDLLSEAPTEPAISETRPSASSMSSR